MKFKISLLALRCLTSSSENEFIQLKIQSYKAQTFSYTYVFYLNTILGKNRILAE